MTKYNQLIWAILIFILGLLAIYTLRVYFKDQNKIQATTERAKCQIEMMKLNQTEFNICQDIFNSTSSEKSFF